MLTNFNFEIIEIIAPALVAGIMVAITHAPLGIEVLKRNIIFIDLAIAQIAGLGLVTANLLLHDESSFLVQIITLTFAIMAALFFRKTEKIMPKQQEAIIGSSFIIATSIAILLLANHPHGSEEIEHLLSGQMLFVTWGDILKHLPIYLFVFAMWFLKPKVRYGIWFYILFALAITSSVQLVGVYVVFASLILPALSAIRSKRPYISAWLCGIISVILGIILSTIFDLPAGPVLVISYGFCAYLVFISFRTP